MDEGAVVHNVDTARLVMDDGAFFIPAKEPDAILHG